MKIQIALAIVGSVALSLAANATTIDFEAQGASAPSSFNGKTNSPLTIGIATFTGGELLRNSANSADKTAVYATTNLAGGRYADPLTILFAQPVSNFSVVLTNEIPDVYTVADNVGGSSSLSPNANTAQTFSLTDAGITGVTIASASMVEWNYAIDNVTFTAATTSAPEPAMFLPVACVLAIVALLAGRQRFQLM
ncbi:MAG: hypothetical protein M3Y72_17720 [Acidobacteriota bacterium]|nr:hypothetical protein [Acidobacteriota bacterium]